MRYELGFSKFRYEQQFCSKELEFLHSIFEIQLQVEHFVLPNQLVVIEEKTLDFE